MSSSLSLFGKVALVTGGSRGIGAAIAKKLAQLGAKVLVNYNSSPAPAQQVVADIVAAGGQAAAVGGDVSQGAQVKALFAEIDAKHGGRLDILVNNAGVYGGGAFVEFSEKEFDKQFAVNVKSVFLVSQEALKRLPDGGRIINIGSGLGERVPFPGVTVYSATKFAVNGLTRGMARDLAPRGITVNNIQPGPVDTDMNPADATKNPGADFMRSAIPLGRYGKTADIANAVAFFASPEASFITGANLNVDGGMLA